MQVRLDFKSFFQLKCHFFFNLEKLKEGVNLMMTQSYGSAMYSAEKVKTQYVHLNIITDTSIKHTISPQSTPMLKCCIYTI